MIPLVILFEDGMMLWRMHEDDSLDANSAFINPLSLSDQNIEFEYKVFFLSDDQLHSLVDMLKNDIGVIIDKSIDIGRRYLGVTPLRALFFPSETEWVLYIPINFFSLEPTVRLNAVAVGKDDMVDQRDMTDDEYTMKCREIFSNMLDVNTSENETGIFANLNVRSQRHLPRGDLKNMYGADITAVVTITCSDGKVLEKTCPFQSIP